MILLPTTTLDVSIEPRIAVPVLIVLGSTFAEPSEVIEPLSNA